MEKITTSLAIAVMVLGFAITAWGVPEYEIEPSTNHISKVEFLDHCFKLTKKQIRDEGKTFVGEVGSQYVNKVMLPIIDGIESQNGKALNEATLVLGFNSKIVNPEVVVKSQSTIDFIAKDFEYYTPAYTNKITLAELQLISTISELKYEVYSVVLADIDAPIELKYQVYNLVLADIDAPIELKCQVYNLVLADIDASAELKYQVYDSVLADIDAPIELKYQVYNLVLADIDAPIELKYEVYDSVLADINASAELKYQVYDSVLADIDVSAELKYQVQYKILQDITTLAELDISNVKYSKALLSQYCYSTLYVAVIASTKESIKEEYMEKWVEVEQNLLSNPIQYVSIPIGLSGSKFVIEVNTATNETENANQRSELEYLKTLGYDGFVVTYRGEDPSYLSSFVQEYKANGWKIGFSYYIGEGTEESQFKNFTTISQAYSLIVPHCDFVLLTWRGSTEHHWRNKNLYRMFVNILANLTRTVSPEIPVLDSVQIDSNGKLPESYTVENTSGLVVYNIGSFYQNNISLLEKNNIVNGIPLVFGASQYWASPHITRSYNKYDKTIYSKEMVRSLCTEVEDGLLGNKIPFTITIMGNGAGDRFGNTDSLTKSTWRK